MKRNIANTALAFYLSILLACSGSSDKPGTLPDLASFSYSEKESALIKGDQSTEKAGAIPGCTGTISPSDTLQRIALVAIFSKTRCYTDADNSNGDYKVSRGELVSSNGAISLTAYRISEPSRKAKNAVGSPHAIYYKFPTQEAYTIYELSGGSLDKVAQISASEVSLTDFIQVSNLTASDIKGSKTYAFVPSKQKLNLFTELATGVEGARLASTGVGDVLRYRYTVTGTPFDTVADYTGGPSSAANRYGQNRKYFLLGPHDSKLGLVWQDQSSAEINLTWLAKDRLSATHAKLSTTSGEVLAAATSDASGNVYYLTIELGDGSPNTARAVTLFKADSAGKQLVKVTPDASKSGGMNMVSFASSLVKNSYAGTMRVSGGKLALMLGRKMHQAGDGLNHQGGIAVIFDASTMGLIKSHGQTSGHSFGNVMMVNKSGKFVGIDLGDNYPRGINLHRFDESSRLSRVVYTFKTRHGKSAANPAGKSFPKYDAASAGGTTYYQWSNDNDTYTELGGVVQTAKGYLVVFIGEMAPLDNSKVGKSLNVPRNVGFVLVREDFQSAKKTARNIVPDDLVLSSGAEEKGGFYDFQGKWNDQRNKGISWLTHYQTTDQNATRLHAAPLPGGQVMLLWEMWDASAYKGTYALKIDHDGKAKGAAVSLGKRVRLGRRDEALVSASGEVILPSGDKTNKKLELLVVEPSK